MGRVEDLRQIAALARYFLGAFTNVGGVAPDVARIHQVFVPQGLIIKSTGDAPEIYSLQAFIEPRERLLTEGGLLDFEEVEVSARTELFGNIAQRWCVYRKSGLLDGERFETLGMKTLQLVRTPQGWKIASLAWDDERPGLCLADAASQARPSPDIGPP
ncbi:MAG: nuclear transport factor 2 family protein [Burkholderiaceae bacterium]|nr:nuclear transport factor 2 family protein [Burkholderiaceae bacterium]